MSRQSVDVCDLPHDFPQIAIDTFTVQLNGSKAEADICEAHKDELTDVLGPYVVLTAAKKRRPAAKAKATARKTSTRRPTDSVVRAWALDNGVDVAPQGRVSNALIEQYRNRSK